MPEVDADLAYLAGLLRRPKHRPARPMAERRPALPPCPACRRPTRTPLRLCWRCRRAATFTFTSVRAFKSGDFNGGYLGGEPTSALPGSPEKVTVMEERARLGLALFHPDDAR